MRVQNLDFIERLNFFLEAIYEDAKKRDNVVIFDYDPAYPRYYKIPTSNIIKTIEYLAKIFILSQSGARILIGFKLSNYSISTLYFEVVIRSNKPLEKRNENLIKLAKEAAKTAEGSISEEEDGFFFSFKAPIASPSQTQTNRYSLSKDLVNYNVVIAYNDLLGFNILSKQLRFAGLKVRPSHDINSLLRHLQDPIFHPDIIFVHKMFLDDAKILKQILELSDRKNCAVCVICEQDDDLKQKFFMLRQPYTYDMLYAALELCHAQNAKDPRERERERESKSALKIFV